MLALGAMGNEDQFEFLKEKYEREMPEIKFPKILEGNASEKSSPQEWDEIVTKFSRARPSKKEFSKLKV